MGATTLVVDLSKSFEKVQLNFVWAMHFGCAPRVLKVHFVIFSHGRRVWFENYVSELVSSITAILVGSKTSVLLLRIVMHDAMRSVVSVFP